MNPVIVVILAIVLFLILNAAMPWGWALLITVLVVWLLSHSNGYWRNP